MSFKSRCYLVYGFAPAGTRAIEANASLNNWISNKKLGKIIYHEHFATKPLGGFAVFEVNEQRELDALRSEPLSEDSHLKGWTLSYHPLTHSTNTDKFIYQTQYTLSSYRDVKMDYQLESKE
ncbi:hypothetical protein [Fictibacillus phosphorivorans]|uniref:Uncharacterized protein n=1 Tax=Fictibacillus phosphorivorans TaxID=1221500 RepID=A0A168W139_9BACL|nr:hypothetical protein [Fictibacillus phosphorivorans]ANC77349.1 hypothetical protein ABE65_011260 [Fictibacillus phosphorivorans]MQR94471.1 hypothetical protein [Fictibacillus phosphorivorans]